MRMAEPEDPAFILSLRLLDHKSYQALTHELLRILSATAGVDEVNSFEIFTLTRDIDQTTDYSARRFPLSLDDCSGNESDGPLDEVVKQHKGGMYEIRQHGVIWYIFDIYENVKPRRLVIIRGHLQESEYRIIANLFQVYQRLVELLDSKERDNLTHLHNRQTMDLILDQVFDFYQGRDLASEDKFSWVAILDIDHFKEVNDTFGHLYGDEVLIIFSRIMEKTFRHTDFIFRYGGEEFLVIINRVTREGAHLALERFRKAVEDYEFSFGKITVSIGYTFVNPKVNQRNLLEFADSALYTAKSTGRNRIVFNDQTNGGINNANDIEFF